MGQSWMCFRRVSTSRMATHNPAINLTSSLDFVTFHAQPLQVSHVIRAALSTIHHVIAVHSRTRASLTHTTCSCTYRAPNPAPSLRQWPAHHLTSKAVHQPGPAPWSNDDRPWPHVPRERYVTNISPHHMIPSLLHVAPGEVITQSLNLRLPLPSTP